MRPDFVFTLEVYCMRVGTDGPATLQLSQSPRPAVSANTHLESRAPVGATPKASRLNFNPTSVRKKARLHAAGDSEQGGGLIACLPATHLLPSFSPNSIELRDQSRSKIAGLFTLVVCLLHDCSCSASWYRVRISRCKSAKFGLVWFFLILGHLSFRCYCR